MEKEYKYKTSIEKENEPWNLAKGYTNDLILSMISDIKRYRVIAVFGFLELNSDVFINNKNLESTARIKGISRLLDSLRTLIVFSKFSLKEKPPKDLFKKYFERTKKMKKFLPRLKIEHSVGGKIKDLSIDENLFNLLLDDLDEMIDNILDILNLSGLIFRQVEIKDPAQAVTN